MAFRATATPIPTTPVKRRSKLLGSSTEEAWIIVNVVKLLDEYMSEITAEVA
jgi:hypothetical protein